MSAKALRHDEPECTGRDAPGCRSEFPTKAFTDLDVARAWAVEFVRWYKYANGKRPGKIWVLRSGQAGVALHYCRLGDYKATLEYDDHALKVNPQSGYAMYRRGVALSRLGQVEAANEQLAAANKADPEIAKVYKEIKMESLFK